MQRSRWEHAGVRRQVQGQGIEEPFAEVDQMYSDVRYDQIPWNCETKWVLNMPHAIIAIQTQQQRQYLDPRVLKL